MRVLVTGATGMIGSHLLGQLLDDHEVHATSRAIDDRRDPRVAWTRIDLADFDAVRELVTRIRPDAICHLAGSVDGRPELDAVQPTVRANLLTSVALLEAAARIGCNRFVTAGSLVEIGGVDGEPLTPGSPYGASRQASSAYARMFHAVFGLPVVVLRPSYVYGPHQRDMSMLVPYVVTSLLHGSSPNLSSGARVMDWLYAGDAAAAFRKALTAEGVVGLTLDVSSGDRRSVREVVELLQMIVPSSSATLGFGELPSRPHEIDLPSGDTTTTREVLDWAPTVSLEEGLKATVDWFHARSSRVPPESTTDAERAG